jgi:4-hydroxybenzoate polyprenyltransferase
MHENEILVLLLSFAVLSFVVLYRRELKRLPAWRVLVCAFAFGILAWLSTVVEHFLFPTFFNVIEHFAYALNGIFLAAWCFMGFHRGTVNSDD